MTEDFAHCPACGDPIDYCQGHGETGDPVGFGILADHDSDLHTGCSAYGCEAAGATALRSFGKPYPVPAGATVNWEGYKDDPARA